MNSKTKVFLKNLSYAFLAQGLSMGLSILMSLIIPKFLGIEEYSYWQLFIFYISYAGFFHLGITDGIYLRTGGKRYKDLEYSLLGTEMKLLCMFQIIVSIIIVIIAANSMLDLNRILVVQGFCFYMVIFNMVAFLGYIFQAVNQTKDYSTAIIIEKLLCLFCIIVLIIFKVKSFLPYIAIYIICDVVALIYCVYIGKKIFFAKIANARVVFKDLFLNICIGGKLLIANLSSLLIIGINRVMIDRAWGIEAFGKFSLSLSLTNFFLLFISQVSMVLFPALRQSKKEHIENFYNIVSKLLGVLLPMIFLLYYPAQYILNLWLPQYKESIKYLALLLPICTFDGRMQLLCNTYFKVLRKENVLLFVNILSFIISGCLGIFGTFIIGNIYFTIVSIVIAIAFRSVLSEIYLGRLMNKKILKDVSIECILAFIFMFTSWFFEPIHAFVIYFVVCIINLIIKKSDISLFTSLIKKRNMGQV
ncbi:oligosaccharide flippase family protein [Robinsoniella peoriensis]|uniref:oligosaccharide flippase family protein n=1 Tax=Robinsoniella peoriensis TaxID=180332 RepID=UPI00085C7240|nr:oligosaccharide flippase family protein [Robinsoniella peoriensis]